jgi:hypothetical protein
VIGAVGEVPVQRRYYACRTCKKTQTPWDDWAGLRQHLTPHAYRLAVLAGSSWSFDMASDRLLEFCGIRLSDDTIRRVSNEAGEQARNWIESSPAAIQHVQEASGNGEFYTDGTCINTREGWREMRLSILARRQAGPAATPQEWSKRYLPPPSARVAMAGITGSQELGPKWRTLADTLGWTRGRGLSALADGAKWIWNQVAEHLPESECVVDVYHVSEHLHACGRELHARDAGAGRAWADERLELLIAQGPMTLLEHLDRERAACGPEQTKSLDALIGYLKPNIDGLWYGDRLRRGLPIGSGMVEGGCKNVLGRRMKCNSGRWRPERADRIAALCCLHYSENWGRFWDRTAIVNN